MLRRLRTRRRITPPPAVFGTPLSTALSLSQHDSVPTIVYACIQYILDIDASGGLETEGIFRVSGSFARVLAIKTAFNEHPDDVDAVQRLALDASDAASVLKMWLREMPEPLFPFACIDEIHDCLQQETLKDRVKAMKRIIVSFPEDNLVLLRYLGKFLVNVVRSDNLMSSRALSIVLAPNILRDIEGNMLVYGAGALQLCLDHIFDAQIDVEEEEEEEDDTCYEFPETDWNPAYISVEEAMSLAARNLHAWNASKPRVESHSEDHEADEAPVIPAVTTTTTAHTLDPTERRLAEHRRRVAMEQKWRSEQRLFSEKDRMEAGAAAAPSLIGTWISRNKQESRLAALQGQSLAADDREERDEYVDKTELRLKVQTELNRLRNEKQTEDTTIVNDVTYFDDVDNAWVPWFGVCSLWCGMQCGIGVQPLNWPPKPPLRPISAQIIGIETVTESYTVYLLSILKTNGEQEDFVTIRRRYSDLRSLHKALARRLGGGALPNFPPRRFLNIANLDPSFVSRRRVLLEAYLQAILQIDAVSRCDVVRSVL